MKLEAMRNGLSNKILSQQDTIKKHINIQTSIDRYKKIITDNTKSIDNYKSQIKPEADITSGLGEKIGLFVLSIVSALIVVMFVYGFILKYEPQDVSFGIYIICACSIYLVGEHIILLMNANTRKIIKYNDQLRKNITESYIKIDSAENKLAELQYEQAKLYNTNPEDINVSQTNFSIYL